MNIFLMVYCAIMPFAWALNACAVYADAQWRYRSIAESDRGDHMAFAVFWSLLTALAWPIFVPFVWMSTNFYKHGFAIPGTDPFGARERRK